MLRGCQELKINANAVISRSVETGVRYRDRCYFNNAKSYHGLTRHHHLSCVWTVWTVVTSQQFRNLFVNN